MRILLAAATPGNAERNGAAVARFGPHRVRMTLEQDDTPSTTIEAAARVKKSAAVAPWVVRYQPPPPMSSGHLLLTEKRETNTFHR